MTSHRLAPIVCFSHLGWDTRLFQRPQQLMARMAARGHKVYYFACVGYKQHKKQPAAGAVEGHPNLHVYTLPFAPGVTRFRGGRRWLASLKVASVLARHRVHRPVLWFYHPALFALGYAHRDSAIVYDVMDHFVSFEGADDDFYFDELTLLAESDVVFAGGQSLHKSTRGMIDVLLDGQPAGLPTPAVHCLPSGIDYDHFRKALDGVSDAGMAKITSPVFGYFGAIDERLDWDLLRLLAAQTNGRIVLAGPVIGALPPDVPANIHLPGAVPYAQLPLLLASFNVCLIPFRQTALVQYVSPTKTPEYLAGGKPVVSTPVPDVIADYGNMVSVARDNDDFVARCLQLATNPPDATLLSQQVKTRVRTWDQLAEEMLLIVDKIVAKV